MSHNFLWNANFHSLLKAIDQDLAAQAQQEGCPACGHKLHQANYPRSPVGMPFHFRSYYDERLSLCCEMCRQRMTPASVRFFGRRWYPGPLFILISALLRGVTESLLRQIKGCFSISITASTLKRWRQWWHDVFPTTLFWKQAKGLVAPLEPKRSFPCALLELFQGKTRRKNLFAVEISFSPYPGCFSGFLRGRINPQSLSLSSKKTITYPCPSDITLTDRSPEMSKDTLSNPHQARWARFRFSIIGPLLSAPPKKGELKTHLEALAKKKWQHPLTGEPISLSFSTLERWFYRAKKTQDPVSALRTKRRTDASLVRKLSSDLKRVIQRQHQEHPSWSYQLQLDNLSVRVIETPALGPIPSYSTLYRYMKTHGLCKQRRVTQRHTEGALIAQERLEHREVRSYEMEYVHSLWHLDFHHGSRKLLGKDGKWVKPLLLAIEDDYSRLVCHAQWYLDETTESLVHGFRQALQKRGLPRALMSDYVPRHIIRLMFPSVLCGFKI